MLKLNRKPETEPGKGGLIGKIGKLMVKAKGKGKAGSKSSPKC